MISYIIVYNIYYIVYIYIYRPNTPPLSHFPRYADTISAKNAAVQNSGFFGKSGFFLFMFELLFCDPVYLLRIPNKLQKENKSRQNRNKHDIIYIIST